MRYWDDSMRALCLVTVAVLVTALAGFSYQRNRIWSTEIELWEDAVFHSPRKARANFNLAIAYMNSGLWGEAEKSFGRTLEIIPEYHRAKYFMAEALFRQGRYVESLRFLKEVERLYEGVLPLFPAKAPEVAGSFSAADLYNNLGSVYYYLGDSARAREYYEKALHSDPSHLKAMEGLVDVLLAEGREGDALRQMERILNLAPPGYEKKAGLQMLINKLKEGK